MNRKSALRLASLLTLSAGVALCLSILLAAAMAVFVLLGVFGVDVDYRVELDVPIRLVYVDSQPAADAAADSPARLLASSASTVEAPLGMMGLPERVLLLVCLLGNVLTTYWLFRFLRDVRAGKLFDARNAWRIRGAGMAAILSGITGEASGYVLARRLMHNFSVSGAEAVLRIDTDVRFVFIGLFVILLAEVFRLGACLQHEQDLTV